MKKTWLLSLALILFHVTFAQKRQFNEAEVHFQYEEYNLAIPLYEAYLQAEPDGKNALEANYKLGVCHLQGSQRGKALPYLEYVYNKKPDYNKNLNYYLAQSYHVQHQWDKAEKFYKMIDKKSGFYQYVEKDLQECTYGRQYTNNPKRIIIENMGDVINTEHDEYVPVISEDEKVLMFTASHPNTTGGGKDPKNEFIYFEDIYVCEKKDDKWTTPKNLPRPINSNSHDACMALSPDGKTLFVFKTGEGKNGRGDIYYSEKTNDGWTDPKSLGKSINTDEREPSVTITHDGKTIYFSSDRKGGLGGLDIYKSTKNEKGEWGEPVNLGPTINTPYDEDSPFIHNETTLYFSSQGHTSMGGYDIFVTKLENNQWGKPENLGYPINTADDDIYYVVSKNEERGYLSSARAGGFGEKDLYVVYLKDPNTPVVTTTTTTTTKPDEPQKPKYKTIVKGTITDAKTQEKLVADIVMISLKENITEQELISKEPVGKYETEKLPTGKSYLINVNKEGYLFHSESFNVPPQPEKDQEIIVDIALLKLAKGEKINLTVFYDFDKDFLRLESKPELERLVAFLQKYPKLKVEIAGHTDAIGTDQKNLGLSDRRSQSVVRYLVERGIDPKRLVAKGYGESKPVATNETDEGRQLNRRTECVVLEY